LETAETNGRSFPKKESLSLAGPRGIEHFCVYFYSEKGIQKERGRKGRALSREDRRIKPEVVDRVRAEETGKEDDKQ